MRTMKETVEYTILVGDSNKDLKGEDGNKTAAAKSRDGGSSD